MSSKAENVQCPVFGLGRGAPVETRVLAYYSLHILQWKLAEPRAGACYPRSILHWVPEVLEPDIPAEAGQDLRGDVSLCAHVYIQRTVHCYLGLGRLPLCNMPGSIMATRTHCNMFGWYTATGVSGSFFWSMCSYTNTQISTSFLWSVSGSSTSGVNCNVFEGRHTTVVGSADYLDPPVSRVHRIISFSLAVCYPLNFCSGCRGAAHTPILEWKAAEAHMAVYRPLNMLG